MVAAVMPLHQGLIPYELDFRVERFGCDIISCADEFESDIGGIRLLESFGPKTFGKSHLEDLVRILDDLHGQAVGRERVGIFKELGKSSKIPDRQVFDLIGDPLFPVLHQNPLKVVHPNIRSYGFYGGKVQPDDSHLENIVVGHSRVPQEFVFFSRWICFLAAPEQTGQADTATAYQRARRRGFSHKIPSAHQCTKSCFCHDSPP
jgi:hypothetical protein